MNFHIHVARRRSPPRLGLRDLRTTYVRVTCPPQSSDECFMNVAVVVGRRREPCAREAAPPPTTSALTLPVFLPHTSLLAASFSLAGRLKIPRQGNKIRKSSLIAKPRSVRGQTPTASDGCGGACSPAALPWPRSGSPHLPRSESGTDLRLSQRLRDVRVPLWVATPWKGKGENRPS